MSIPLALESDRLLRDGTTLAATTRVIDDWAPDHALEDIVIDRRDDATHVSIRVVGTEPPPATSALADLLANELETEVVAGVAFSRIEEVRSSPPQYEDS